MNHIVTLEIKAHDNPSAVTVAAVKNAVERALEPILLGATVTPVTDPQRSLA